MIIENNEIVSFEEESILTIPKNVDSISWESLMGNDNKAEKIVVEDGNKKFITNGSVLIDKENKSIVLGLSNAEVPLDGSVDVIEREAFLNREFLKRISLPNTIKSIGYRAFAGTGLSEMALPEQLEIIDSLAFWNCKDLRKIFIPKSVKTIGKGVFAGCDALREIVVEKENENYISLNNCLIDKKTNTVIAVCDNGVIPEGVEAIGEMTLFMNFNCSSITIPASVTEIKEHEVCKNFEFCGMQAKDGSGTLEKPLTLIVEKDSFAEKYAKENNIKYKTVNISMPYPYNLISCIFGVGHYGDGVILNKDLMMAIETLLSNLTKEERDVFDYHFVSGLSRDEIALSLDITEDDVYGILAKIMRRLRHPTRSRLLRPFIINSGIEECFKQEEMVIDEIEVIGNEENEQ